MQGPMIGAAPAIEVKWCPNNICFLDGTKSSSSLCLCAGVIFLSFKLNILIDISLGRFKQLFAAAGHPYCIFKINYRDLIKITNGLPNNITEWDNQI